MSWLFFAIAAPALYATTNFIDKFLIEKHVEDIVALAIKTALSSLGLKNSKYVNELSALSNKYLELKFWVSSLALKSVIRDEQNNIFRYPESSVGFVLDIENLPAVSEANIQELEDDLVQLEKLVLKLWGQVTDEKIKTKK